MGCGQCERESARAGGFARRDLVPRTPSCGVRKVAAIRVVLTRRSAGSPTGFALPRRDRVQGGRNAEALPELLEPRAEALRHDIHQILLKNVFIYTENY